MLDKSTTIVRRLILFEIFNGKLPPIDFGIVKPSIELDVSSYDPFVYAYQPSFLLMSVSAGTVRATWSYPPFSQLHGNTDCNVTTNYIADSVLMVTKGDYLTNRELGDIGFLVDWLDDLVPAGYGGLPNSSENWLVHDELLIVWYYGVWQNDSFTLNDSEWAAYNNIENQAEDFAYTCLDDTTGQKMICNKLDIRGDPDVSGRGVRFPNQCQISATYCSG